MRFIFILCMLLSSFPTFGQIDGKGLICSSDNISEEDKLATLRSMELLGIYGASIDDIKLAILFENKSASILMPAGEDGIVKYEKLTTDSYTADPQKIHFESGSYLDRKTLKINDNNKFLSCEIFESADSLNKELSRLSIILQKKLDMMLEGNKI